MKKYTYNQSKCPPGGGSPALKWVGIALMAIGALILLISVPFKFWLAVLGLIFVMVGFILLRMSL